jgi:hypothetical protein
MKKAVYNGMNTKSNFCKRIAARRFLTPNPLEASPRTAFTNSADPASSSANPGFSAKGHVGGSGV